MYVGRFNYFLIYHSHRVKLVHGVRDLEVALFKAKST